MITRRDFVKGGVALVSIGTGANSLLKGAIAFAAGNPAELAAATGKTLVLVQLTGGNDGLNTVAPVSNGAYRTARRTIGVTEESGLPLANGFALHPNLPGLKSLWDQKKLGIVQGVGYPQQDYSHFKSMAIWQSGDPNLSLQDGWLGRTLDALESDTHDPFFGFNVGSSTPPEMRHPAISIPSVQDPADYNFKRIGQPVTSTDPRTATMLKLYEQYPAQSPFGALLETTVDTAVQSAQQLADAATRYTPAVTYPQTSFGSGLSLLAETIVAGLGMRVGHISLGGFDTHNNQVAEHDALMTTLDQGLAAFYADLEAHGKLDDVLVLTWSEFGRRVQENFNGGTDHGSASVCFAIGSQVQGGLYGETPNLDALIDNGNLQYTVDFRRVYSTVIERWLGVPSAPLLGQQWEPLAFLRA